jgi:hypothetical protein
MYAIKLPPFLYSPAYPAAWLLFGMLFAQAAAHFGAMPWPRLATVAVYSVPLAWVSSLAWRKRWHIRFVTALDVLFVGFLLLVSASLFFQSGVLGEAGRFAFYFPFLVVVPYLCGRLMRVPDIKILMRIILTAGMSIMPLLLVDRFTLPMRETERWPFFGLDHGALLVGALLASTLIALCVRILDLRNIGERNNRPKQIFLYGLVGLTTVFLVWVTARGWLLVGLAGVAVACLSARQQFIWKRTGLLAAVLTMVGLSMIALPKLDSQFGRLYAMTTDISSQPVIYFGGGRQVPGEAVPVLGEASCQPIKEGVNSIAIRWMLYQEAMAMFLENPILGVGAARFGEQSCTGPKGFPHSTILQGFAELGVIGGGLLIGMLILAVVTLLRPFLSVRHRSNWSTDAFILASFATFLGADQIYGNYFMSVGSWLMLGIAASMRASNKLGDESRV